MSSFAAEAAADQRATDADLFVLQAERRRHLIAILVGDLRTDVDGQLVVARVALGDADGAFWLQESVLRGRRLVFALDNHIRSAKP